MNKYAKLFLNAVTGAALVAASGDFAKAELIDGAHKEIICKRPKTNERQLKIHSCQTSQYPLAPLAAPAGGINPPVPPDPGPYLP